MHHARRHQGRGAVWPPKRKKQEDRWDARVLGGSRGRAETRKNEWGWVRRCGRKQKEGGADPQRVEEWKPRRAVVGWSPRKDR